MIIVKRFCRTVETNFDFVGFVRYLFGQPRGSDQRNGRIGNAAFYVDKVRYSPGVLLIEPNEFFALVFVKKVI